jgi:hypothetical protein
LPSVTVTAPTSVSVSVPQVRFAVTPPPAPSRELVVVVLTRETRPVPEEDSGSTAVTLSLPVVVAETVNPSTVREPTKVARFVSAVDCAVHVAPFSSVLRTANVTVLRIRKSAAKSAPSVRVKTIRNPSQLAEPVSDARSPE